MLLGAWFYLGLWFVWHIPPLTVQFGFHWLNAVSAFIFGFYVPIQKMNEDFPAEKIDLMYKKNFL